MKTLKKSTAKTENKLKNLKPFKKGKDPRRNLKGRPKGSGISITTEIKRKLAKIPKGKKSTYLQLLINKIFKQAIEDGDQQMIKNIWNYVDGLPKQPIEHSGEVNSNLNFDINLTLKKIYGKSTEGAKKTI